MEERLYMPFVRATVETFETMVGIKPEMTSAKRDASQLEQREICAILGLSGDAVGMTSVAFTEKTALKAMGHFLGEELTEVNEDVYDAVGEIINIIAGAAKAEFKDTKMMISLPSVMHGEKVFLSLPKNAPVITLTFKLPEVGEMVLLLSIKES